MIFRENLHNTLRDIYNMTTKLGFSAEYVEGLSPSERGIHIQYFLEEQEEERKNAQNTNSGPTIGSPIGE
jgi:hypothetical protein